MGAIDGTKDGIDSFVDLIAKDKTPKLESASKMLATTLARCSPISAPTTQLVTERTLSMVL